MIIDKVMVIVTGTVIVRVIVIVIVTGTNIAIEIVTVLAIINNISTHLSDSHTVFIQSSS